MRYYGQKPTHSYQGYVLVMSGMAVNCSGEHRIAIGPKAHERYQFQIGDSVTCNAEPVPHPEHEWAHFHKACHIKLHGRTSDRHQSPGPDGGLASNLLIYRTRGHLRLDKKTCESACIKCPWGVTMPTDIVSDHSEFRFETHCFGPRDCPIYHPGQPYRIDGAEQWMDYEDDDYERWHRGGGASGHLLNC